MTMQSKAWMTTFLFKEFFFFFKRSILSGISLTNKHLFIFDGHGSHVTLKTIKQAQAFGLNIVTLLSHTSHAFGRNLLQTFQNYFQKAKIHTNDQCELH